MLNLVIFGAPGAGKGTQAAMLIEKYNLVHLSTGDLLRKEIAEGTEIGKQAQAIMARGEFVSDEMVVSIISGQIDRHADANGFIFDGFPRTVRQAGMLDELLKSKNMSISIVVAMEVPETELVRRLLERGKVSGRADDQNMDVIANRIHVYHEKTEPVTGYYDAQKKFVSVNGLGAIEEIFGRLTAVIDQVK